MDDNLKPVIDALNEMKEDNTVPKNVKAKVEKMTECILKGDGDLSLRLNQCVNEFEEISNDVNLQPYTRTQIWNIVALIEASLNH